MSDVVTVLESVNGVGPATRTAILDRFPTLDALAGASVEDLTDVKGVGPATARSIKKAVTQADVKVSEAPRAAAAGAVADLKQARDQAATKARTTAKKVQADVEETRKEVTADVKRAAAKVDDQADDAVAALKGALTSIQKVLLAAIEAGKEEWPNTERQLKAALTSIRKTGETVISSAGNLRRG
ncbi:MAG: helix-hairpin-helix domain-containing protein [Actinomycetes bacterium]